MQDAGHGAPLFGQPASSRSGPAYGPAIHDTRFVAPPSSVTSRTR